LLDGGKEFGRTLVSKTPASRRQPPARHQHQRATAPSPCAVGTEPLCILPNSDFPPTDAGMSASVACGSDRRRRINPPDIRLPWRGQFFGRAAAGCARAASALRCWCFAKFCKLLLGFGQATPNAEAPRPYICIAHHGRGVGPARQLAWGWGAPAAPAPAHRNWQLPPPPPPSRALAPCTPDMPDQKRKKPPVPRLLGSSQPATYHMQLITWRLQP
jgi:hypothetical protein